MKDNRDNIIGALVFFLFALAFWLTISIASHNGLKGEAIKLGYGRVNSELVFEFIKEE